MNDSTPTRPACFGSAVVSMVLLIATGCGGDEPNEKNAAGDPGKGSSVDCSALPTIQEPHNSVNACPIDAEGNSIAGLLCGEIISCYVGFCPEGVTISQEDAAVFRACYCSVPPLLELLERCGE